MSENSTEMAREIAEIPAAAARALTMGLGDARHIPRSLRQMPPGFAVSVARGSSDHVACFLKYAFELELGLPVASLGPSVASIYGGNLRCQGALCLAISQSGQSPDIRAMTRTAILGGARAVAITNDAASPLAEVADYCLALHAGPERSVAATKTFVNSALLGLMMLAEWAEDDALRGALKALPEALERAVALDWAGLAEGLAEGRSLYTLGRGPAWAISNEAALKFKETCRIHAESYSAAEVMHGPVSIVEEGFGVLCFASGDAAEASVAEAADALAGKGAKVFVTSELAREATTLPHIRTGHRLTDPLVLLASFYAMVERVAALRGINPDRPRHLNKVTETI